MKGPEWTNWKWTEEFEVLRMEHFNFCKNQILSVFINFKCLHSLSFPWVWSDHSCPGSLNTTLFHEHSSTEEEVEIFTDPVQYDTHKLHDLHDILHSNNRVIYKKREKLSHGN